MNRDKIVLKRPASWEKDMWKGALPIGSGITGGLVFGAIAEEQVIVTRHDLWHKGGGSTEIPDISEEFHAMRKLIDEGKYFEGCHKMQRALNERGYSLGEPSPFPLGSLKISYIQNGVDFKKYRRGINMEKAIAFVSWEDQRGKSKREYFVSRDNGILYCRVNTDFASEYRIDFDTYNNLDGASAVEIDARKELLTKKVSGNTIFYAANTDGQDFGAEIMVEASEGEIKAAGDAISVKGKSFIVKLLSFAKKDRCVAEDELKDILLSSDDFETALHKHEEKHKALYKKTDICIAEDNDKRWEYTNEELLDEAYDDTASDVLVEKLWRFGRYLFISAMHEEANPFPLYGLWPGAYKLPWTAHVCNENVESIYWHVLSGGLAESIKSLVNYYYNKLPYLRGNAKKLYGCRGIFVPVYTFPETMDGLDTAPPYPVVPVTLNWISGAGWLCCHFYDYYKYTKDTELLNTKIIPLMLEAAYFYEDYVVFDEEGRVRIYPSVSPENTPSNLNDLPFAEGTVHACPATENATMDFAILKKHLKNLLEIINDEGCETDIPEEKIKVWKNILSRIPKYMMNEDGAVCEWMSEKLKDNYDHRHFSHLFPVFPGGEITAENNPVLSDAFRKAADLRVVGAMSGWSFPHLAEFYTRYGDGDRAFNCLATMCKGLVTDNFFTLHNDWRHMGTGMIIDHMTPVQLDALMGSVSVVQDMVFQYKDNSLYILPALPSRIKYVKAENLHFPGGKVSVKLENGFVTVCFITDKDEILKVYLNGKEYKVNAGKDVVANLIDERK